MELEDFGDEYLSHNNNEDGTTSAMSVKSGDVVLYGKYSGTEITYEGKDLLIMRESDILAIL